MDDRSCAPMDDRGLRGNRPVHWLRILVVILATTFCAAVLVEGALSFVVGCGFDQHGTVRTHGLVPCPASLRLPFGRMGVSSQVSPQAFVVMAGAAGIFAALRRYKRQLATGTQSLTARANATTVVEAPQPSTLVSCTGISLWHDVDLHVRNVPRRDVRLFRYVNEMPRGTFRKFEVQTTLPGNIIVENSKDSRRLQAYGKPTAFNYGCFPQTYRDPDKLDSLYGASGDDDPLDAIDISDHVVGVGAVVQCRPIGAVCLIDEGRADWKILVVNVDLPGPFVEARSVEDVERISPGRVKACLDWLDGFKRSSGNAVLHYTPYNASWAQALIEQDHESWRQLASKVGCDGFACRHWIQAPLQPLFPRAGRANLHNAELECKTM